MPTLILLIFMLTGFQATAEPVFNVEAGIANEQSSYNVKIEHLTYDNTDKASRTAFTLGVGVDMPLMGKTLYNANMSVLEGNAKKWQNNSIKLENNLGYRITDKVTALAGFGLNRVYHGEYPVRKDYVSYQAGIRYNLTDPLYLKLDYSYSNSKGYSNSANLDNSVSLIGFKVGYSF